MISELYHAAMCLKDAGYNITGTHPDVHQAGGYCGFLVFLDKDGNASSVQEMSRDEMKNKWTIRSGKQHSFPLIKVPPAACPALMDQFYSKHRKDKKNWPYILRDSKIALSPGTIRPNEWAINTLSDACTDEKTSAVRALVERFPKTDHAAEKLTAQISSLIFHNIPQDIESTRYKAIEKICFGSKTKKQKTPLSNACLFFELSDYSNYTYPISSPVSMDIVSEALLRTEKQDGPMGVCSLSGKTGPLLSGNFPEITIPHNGNAYLYSCNRGNDSLRRYGKSGNSLVPISRDSALDAAGAAAFLMNENARGKTWKPVPGASKTERDIMLVYLLKDPGCDINLSAYIADESEQDQSQSMRSSVAKAFCDALDSGKHGDISSTDLIRIIIIRRIDRGRAQVRYSKIISADQIRQKLQEWEKMCDVSDLIRLPSYDKNGPLTRIDAHEMYGSYYKTAKVLKNAYSRSLRDILDLLLCDHLNRTELKVHLAQVLSRRKSYLVQLQGRKHPKEEKSWKERVDIARKTLRYLYLLFAKNHLTKEDITMSVGYAVGRIVQLYDTLHKCWCNEVREGKLPPMLIGSGYYQGVEQSPMKGLIYLRRRAAPYEAWAEKTVSKNGKSAALAMWARNELRKCYAVIEEHGWPEKTDLAFRGQMLLGFYSSNSKKGDNK